MPENVRRRSDALLALGGPPARRVFASDAHPPSSIEKHPSFRPLSIPSILPTWIALVSLCSNVPCTFITVVVHLIHFFCCVSYSQPPVPTGHAFPFRYMRRGGIPRTAKKYNAKIRKIRLQTTSSTFRSPVNDSTTTTPLSRRCRGSNIRCKTVPARDAPQQLARLQRWGLTFGASFSLFMPYTLNSYYKPVSLLQYLGGCRTRRLVRFLFSSFTHICAKIDAYSGIYDTTHLSYFAPQSRYSPNMALRPSVALHQDVWSRYA